MSDREVDSFTPHGVQQVAEIPAQAQNQLAKLAHLIDADLIAGVVGNPIGLALRDKDCMTELVAALHNACTI